MTKKEIKALRLRWHRHFLSVVFEATFKDYTGKNTCATNERFDYLIFE